MYSFDPRDLGYSLGFALTTVPVLDMTLETYTSYTIKRSRDLSYGRVGFMCLDSALSNI